MGKRVLFGILILAILLSQVSVAHVSLGDVGSETT